MLNKKIAVTVVFMGLFLCAGCVEQRLTIHTEPEGALVMLNDEEIGISPVTVGFNWYGDYKVRISKEGYNTLNTHRQLKGPVYDAFPIDFFAQVLWPGRIVDEYEWTFELENYQPPDKKELIEKAGVIKQKAQAELTQQDKARLKELEQASD